MRILFISSEVAPFSKTGGLGDVSAALPRALAAAGHEVRVVAPLYRRSRKPEFRYERALPERDITLGSRRYRFSVCTSPLPDSKVTVDFIDCPALYDRPGIYTQDPDEHIRFALLQWAALSVCQQLGWAPDVVHCNDWQTALVPLMLRTLFAWDRLFARTRTVLTIHNIGHQGAFGADALADTGLADAAQHFHQDQLREGRLNYMLTGIMYANAITTVSPTYAREIMTPEHGVGLDAFLRARRDVMFGILNGIDAREWSPGTDPHLPAPFSVDDLRGKRATASALCATMGLDEMPGTPLLAIVSRLVWQKGLDLCEQVLPGWLSTRNAQLAVLGSGEPRYETFFARLARHFPRRVAFHRGFSEPLAHLLEGGADMFLMPSRYEPCGLNQMYSLAYGTVPIVHRTGGLADTVRTWDARGPVGNGFAFEHFDAHGLVWALDYALETWRDRAAWTTLQARGMREDHGWGRRVGEYESVYRFVAP